MITIPINNVTFGNPTQEQLALMDVPLWLNGIIDVNNYPQPLNDSIVTRQELNEITESIDKIKMPHNTARLESFQDFDKKLTESIVSYFKKEKDLDFTDLCNNIESDLENFIYSLKYFYNRPRPRQLANVLKLSLVPFTSETANTPSYPSGHTLIGSVILKTIEKLHPTLSEETTEMQHIIAESRIFLGVHYRSDNDFSFELAAKIVSNENFIKKYLDIPKT